MSEFDILLAQEYAKCRGLYDKKSPQFKDRIYADNAWREMSNVLGYSVNILKDRMLQLRNRYNVEKRKFDYLRSKNPNARAKWSMFQHMNFLEGHIRQRRRTRGMGKAFYNSVRSEEARLNGLTPRRRGRPPKIDRKYSDHDNTNDGEDDDDDEEQDGSLLNENEIKDEIRSETNSNSNQGDDEADQFINPANLLAQTTSEEPHDSDNNIPSSTLPTHNQGNQRFNGMMTMNHHRLPTKYQAFGQFVTASLSELPAEKALDLLQTFTMQLVGAMRPNVESDKGE